jgi:hypothetical protein
MDDRKHSISHNDLYIRLGSEAAPTTVDVRCHADFAGVNGLMADAFHDAQRHWPARAVGA